MRPIDWIKVSIGCMHLRDLFILFVMIVNNLIIGYNPFIF